MSGAPTYSFSPSELEMYGSWTSSLADHSQVPAHLPNPGESHSSTESDYFTLLRPQPNSDHLGGGLFGHTDEPDPIGIDKRAMASQFHNQIKSFVNYLDECKDRYELIAYPLEHKEMLKAYKDEAENIQKGAQELIKMSSGAMWTAPFHDDGTPTQEAWDAFMRSFLSTNHQLETTQNLMRDMDSWVCYYEADCEPKHFVFMGQEVGRDELTRQLLYCADYVYADDSPAPEPVHYFCRRLGLIVEEVGIIRHHERFFEIEGVSRKWSEAREVMDSFIQARDRLYTRIKALIAACEAATPVPYRHKNGFIRYHASCMFMEALLGEARQLPVLQALVWDMHDWLKSYDTDCAPLLRRIKEHAERIQGRAERQARQHR